LLEVGFVGWPGEPDHPLVDELAAHTRRAGRVLVITFGSAGVRVVDARGSRSDDRWFDVDPVPVVGTTVGCGDAFISAFLEAWYRTPDVDEAVDAGRSLGAAATGWDRPLPDSAYC